MSTAGWKFAVTGQSLIKHDLRPFVQSTGLSEVVGCLCSADVSFTNYEGTITGGFGGWPTKAKSISAPGVEVIDTLERMGFNMLSLSNNHAFDLGPGGILSTLAALTGRDVVHAGIGIDGSAAAKPGMREFSFGKSALVAADCGPQPDYVYALDAVNHIPSRPGVNRLQLIEELSGIKTPDPSDMERYVAAIAAAAKQARFVVAYLHSHHWESDAEQTPDWQRTFARTCIDQGAHAVVCHGVPLLQGIELYRSKPIFYGLGNFIFHTYQPHRWRNQFDRKPWESVIAMCHFSGTADLERMELIPLVVGGDPEGVAQANGCSTEQCAPRFATGESRRSILHRLQRLSSPFGTHIVVNEHYGVISSDS